MRNCDWEQRKLEDLAESFNYGLNASAMEFDGENKYIRITDIDEYSHRFIESGLTSPNTDLSNADDYLLKEGDILFARTGASVGKSYQYEPLDGKVYYAGFLIRARIKPEFHSSFIFQNTLTEKYNNFIKITSQRSGQPGVNAQEYANFSIMVPSRGEQVKLGNFFKQLDNTIALHQRKLEKSKALKSAYLSDMFPAEGDRKPKRRFAGFTDDWEQRKLKELTEVITKGTTPKDKSGKGSINFVKVENINKSSGEIDIKSKITENEHEGYLKRSQLKDGDILFSIAGTLGRTAIVKKELLPANTNQALAIIRLDEGDKNYITTFLNGRAAEDFIKKNPTVGAQPNLSLEQVGNLLIEIPSLEEQTKIGSFFKQLDDTIALHQHKLEKLKNIKQAYLNELFV